MHPQACGNSSASTGHYGGTITPKADIYPTKLSALDLQSLERRFETYPQPKSEQTLQVDVLSPAQQSNKDTSMLHVLPAAAVILDLPYVRFGLGVAVSAKGITSTTNNDESTP